MRKALVVVGLGVAAAVPVYLVQPVFQGIETAAPDRSGLSASDLVAQSTTVTQYLVTLATGIFALVGLLLTDKAGRALRSERASKLLILGCVLTGLSL